MFSSFRRRTPPSDGGDPPRLPVFEDDDLDVELRGLGEEPFPGRLVDLSIAGATVHVGFESDPELEVDDLIQVTIACDAKGWSISTAAQVLERARVDGRTFRYDLDFVNGESLAEQIDEAAGRWFNRRRQLRARPELDAQPTVDLAYRHLRTTGRIFDVSLGGLGTTVDAIVASPFQVGESIGLGFSLPSVKKQFEGAGRIANLRRAKGRTVVGIEFDLETGNLRRRQRDLAAYVERRLAAMAAFERAVREGR